MRTRPAPHRALRRALGLAALLLPATAHAQPTPDPAVAFLPLWKELADHPGWQMLVSPPFPSQWPLPPSGGTLVRYAFAMRFDPRLADGVTMAAPWAKSLVDPAGTTEIEPLSPRLHPLGVQGVRPLRPAEIALVDREPDLPRLLRATADPANATLARNITCSWIARQGVVAAAITPSHPDFTRWLACP